MDNNYRLRTVSDHPLLLPEDKYLEYIFTEINNFATDNIICTYRNRTLIRSNEMKLRIRKFVLNIETNFLTVKSVILCSNF